MTPTLELRKEMKLHQGICELLDALPEPGEVCLFGRRFEQTVYQGEAERLIGLLTELRQQLRYLRDTIYTNAMEVTEITELN
jgi:hypothetical protein